MEYFAQVVYPLPISKPEKFSIIAINGTEQVQSSFPIIKSRTKVTDLLSSGIKSESTVIIIMMFFFSYYIDNSCISFRIIFCGRSGYDFNLINIRSGHLGEKIISHRLRFAVNQYIYITVPS